MNGLIVSGIQWRGLVLESAFFKVGNTSGDEQQGWRGTATMYASRKAFDAGEPGLDSFPVAVAGRNAVARPGGGLPKAANGKDPVLPEWNPEPVPALYAQLRQEYPEAKEAA